MSISAAGEAQGAGEAVLWFRMRAHILLNGGSLQRSSETRPCPGRERRTHAGHAARGLRRDVGRALRLAARNPRVLFIDAMSDYQLAPELGGNKERALVKLRQAVAAFELERAGTEQLPGWGAAEAYELLARDLLDQGETLGARDALEHALLLAPEFSQARRLMAQIISG